MCSNSASFISIFFFFLDFRLSKKKENLFYRWSLEVSDEVTRIEEKNQGPKFLWLLSSNIASFGVLFLIISPLFPKTLTISNDYKRRAANLVLIKLHFPTPSLCSNFPPSTLWKVNHRFTLAHVLRQLWK